MNAGKHRPFLLVMLASFFLLDSQAWEMKFLSQHLTWVTKIRPCKEPVNSALEAVVNVIYLVGVPVIISVSMKENCTMIPNA